MEDNLWDRIDINCYVPGDKVGDIQEYSHGGTIKNTGRYLVVLIKNRMTATLFLGFLKSCPWNHKYSIIDKADSILIKEAERIANKKIQVITNKIKGR